MSAPHARAGPSGSSDVLVSGVAAATRGSPAGHGVLRRTLRAFTVPERSIFMRLGNGPSKPASPEQSPNLRSGQLSLCPHAMPYAREGEGREERDCRLARPIAVWSSAPHRCNDGGLTGGTVEARVGESVTTAAGGKGAGPEVVSLVADHRRSPFSAVVLNARGTRATSGSCLFTEGRGLTDHQSMFVVNPPV